MENVMCLHLSMQEKDDLERIAAKCHMCNLWSTCNHLCNIHIQ